MTSTNPSEPIRNVADSTSDPVTSPDDLSGVQDRFRSLTTTDSPSRPEKSPARGPGVSAMDGINGAVGGASSMASDAYNRAPDLGISSTANNAYQRAPDLGVGATINRVFGRGNQTEQDGGIKNEEEDDERVIRSKDDEGDELQNQGSAYNRREESKQKGPSSQDRIGKTQQEIGTETGIPTAAGAGTTASPDDSNKKALEKASSEGKIKKAHVPEDFEALACPTENAGTGKSKGVELKSGPSSKPKGEKDHSRAGSSSGSSRNSQKGGGGNNSERASGIISSDGSPLEMEKRRSFGEKIKDQVKGELKILAGTVTGKDDKVLQGLAIKHGEYE